MRGPYSVATPLLTLIIASAASHRAFAAALDRRRSCAAGNSRHLPAMPPCL
jgi:hypothetical protein